MVERIYIETAVVSYLTARPSRDLVIAGHQQLTHDWWGTCRSAYELCVSQLVLDEAAAGNRRAAQVGIHHMNDPIVDDVRRVRDAHAERFSYDLDAIFRDIKKREKESGLVFVEGVAHQPLPGHSPQPNDAVS